MLPLTPPGVPDGRSAPIDVDAILAALGDEFDDPGDDPWGGANLYVLDPVESTTKGIRMTDPASWYEDMAKAIKERENCQAAIDRWTAKRNDAEAKMAALGASAPEPPQVVAGTATAEIAGLVAAEEPAAETA